MCRRNAGALEPPADLSICFRVEPHFHCIAFRRRSAAWPAINRREQIPLVDDRVSPAQRAGSRDRTRIHPAPSWDFVTDSRRCSREPREPGAAWSAVQIDDDVVSVAAKPSRQAEIVGNSAQARSPRCDDDVVEMRVLPNDRKRLRFDQVRQVRVRKRAFQRPNQRRRKYDVTNQAEADQKNLHLAGIRCPESRIRSASLRILRTSRIGSRIPDNGSRHDIHGSIVASSISMTGMSSLIG